MINEFIPVNSFLLFFQRYTYTIIQYNTTDNIRNITMALIKIMELVYVVLEAGHVIKELVVVNDTVEIVVCSVDGANTWTVSAVTRHVLNNRIYAKLDALNIVSENDSRGYRMKFYTPLSPSPAPSQLSHEGVVVPVPPLPENDGKNIAIMKFVLGAMSSGWKVRKSLGKRHYTFNKTHHCNKKYLSGSFLSNFLKKNALR